MKNKKFLLFFMLFILLIALPVKTNADIGPKPSVIVDFTGFEGQTYYVTLLSEDESVALYSVAGLYEDDEEYKEGDEDYDIFVRFRDYEDVDGYYFLQYFENCTNDHRFSWTYFPPEKFKILIYMPETDEFLTDNEILDQYAFDSYFTVDYNGGNIIIEKENINKSENLFMEIISLIVRIMLTIIIEILIALLFGLRGKNILLLIIITNVITQILLNISLFLINYTFGMIAFVLAYIILEIIVCIIELVIYTVYVAKKPEFKIPVWKPVVYALVANTASFFIGIILALLLPLIF